MKLILAILLISGSALLATPTALQTRILGAMDAKTKALESSYVDMLAVNASNAQEITKLNGDLDATNDMLVLSTNKITELQKTVDSINGKLDWFAAALNAESAKRVETGRERDAFILLFAILSTLYFYPMLVAFLNQFRVFIQYTWLAYLVAPVAIFLASFLAIRVAVHYLITLIF